MNCNRTVATISQQYTVFSDKIVRSHYLNHSDIMTVIILLKLFLN